jgi:phosphatidylserine decarboxylase
MKLHPEGYKIIATSFVVLSAISVAIWYMPIFPLVKYVLYLGFFLLFSWTVFFFRYPKRTVNKGEDKVLSTADGTVVVIEEVEETEFFNEKRLMISVFMSPMNVHINWYPFAGEVKYAKYHPGRYFIAYNPKSSEHNERTSVVLEKDADKDVLIRQVAGIMARRVVCYSKKGDRVQQGEEMGMIKFGSRIDFFLPLDVKINVSLGDKVKAQETVIAFFNQNGKRSVS